MALSDMLRAWLRLFRAHTAILEAPMAVIGSAIALGSLWEPVIVLWLLFGILYHFVGYGMNSYVDWEKGFDKDDPRKQHHPLNTGEITPEAAKKAIMIGLATLVVYGLALGRFSPIAIASVAIMVVSGVSYNYFGKYTDLKFLPISIVHTMVFFYPYILYRGVSNFPSSNVDYLFIFMTAAYFIHHVFQIMISGDVKDIDQDEASLIQEMGARLNGGVIHEIAFIPGSKVLYTSYILVVAEIAMATTALFMVSDLSLTLGILGLLGMWMAYEAHKVIESGPFNRESRVSHMSRKELAGYLTVHAAAIPVLGYEAFIVLVVFIFAYLFTTSKFMWGNLIKPEV